MLRQVCVHWGAIKVSTRWVRVCQFLFLLQSLSFIIGNKHHELPSLQRRAQLVFAKRPLLGCDSCRRPRGSGMEKRFPPSSAGRRRRHAAPRSFATPQRTPQRQRHGRAGPPRRRSEFRLNPRSPAGRAAGHPTCHAFLFLTETSRVASPASGPVTFLSGLVMASC